MSYTIVSTVVEKPNPDKCKHFLLLPATFQSIFLIEMRFKTLIINPKHSFIKFYIFCHQNASNNPNKIVEIHHEKKKMVKKMTYWSKIERKR